MLGVVLGSSTIVYVLLAWGTFMDLIYAGDTQIMRLVRWEILVAVLYKKNI